MMLSFYDEAEVTLQTIADFIRFGISEAFSYGIFCGHGTNDAYDDIRILILRSLQLPVDTSEMLWHTRLLAKERQHLAFQLYQRIHERIPTPYLISEAFFADLSFYVDRRVLIPRSPIGEMIANHFSPWLIDEVTSILDLCTGSGSLAIAAAYAFPNANIDAVDLSEAALEVAKINRCRHDLQDCITLIQSDLFDAVPQKKYSIILSNPPYVGDEEMATLPKEYLHEPALALRAPQNGLAVVQKILESAHHYLEDQGILVVEVGNSADALIEVFPTMPFIWIEFERGGEGVFLLTREMLVTYWESV